MSSLEVNKMRLFKQSWPFLFTLFCFYFSPSYADIAYSGSSTNSIEISTEESENSLAYTLIIHIKGVNSTNVKLFPDNYGELIMLAQSGNISGGTIAGGQSIRYSFSFGKDADINKMKRFNAKNKIIVTIPKQ